MGFFDPEGARRLLGELGEAAETLLPLIGRSADPDQALSALVALAEAADDREALLAEVADDEGTSMRLLSVLGSSVALGEHLRRHPAHWHELTDPVLGSTRPSRAAMRVDLMRAVGADPDAEAPVAAIEPAVGPGRPARGVPPAAPPAGLTGPGPPPRRRRRGR